MRSEVVKSDDTRVLNVFRKTNNFFINHIGVDRSYTSELPNGRKLKYENEPFIVLI